MMKNQEGSSMIKRSKPVAFMLSAVFILASAAPGYSFWFFKKKSEPKLVVPVCSTPQEQFAYATVYQRTQILHGEEDKRAGQLDKIIQCYEAVCTNFPNDVVFTPIAYLEIADCVNLKGDQKKAIQMYDAAISKYPDNDYLQARSLTAIGKSYDMLGKNEKAKTYYKQVMDRFADSEKNSIRDIVKRANHLYYTLKEEGTTQKDSQQE
jgi:tetratricopeptide (TPR) repeat protein